MERPIKVFFDDYPAPVATRPPDTVIGEKQIHAWMDKLSTGAGGGSAILVILDVMHHFFSHITYEWMMEGRRSLPDVKEAFDGLEIVFRRMATIKELTAAGVYQDLETTGGGMSPNRAKDKLTGEDSYE